MNEEKTTKNRHPVLRILGWVGIVCVIVALGGFTYYQYQTITQRNQQISVLSEEKVSLEGEKQSLSTTIGDITSAIDEIAAKLQDVKKKQVVITELVSLTAEGTQKERILNDINAIESQLEKDKRDIDEITQKMRVSGIKIKSLETLIGTLRKEIVAHVERIDNLKSIVENKNEVIRTTENTLQDTKQTLSIVQTELEQTSEELNETKNTLEVTRNTAYYVIGTKNELREKNVIDEKGWFVFNKDINLSSEISESAFDKIDITRDKEFTIPDTMKHVKILPERSNISYTLQENGNNQSVLKVTDPENFWKIRYVAVVVKG